MATKKFDQQEISKRVTKSVESVLQLSNHENSSEMIDLNLNTDIFSYLGIDSVEVMDLISMIEKEFNIAINLEKLSSKRTIKDIIELVNESLLEEN